MEGPSDWEGLIINMISCLNSYPHDSRKHTQRKTNWQGGYIPILDAS